MTTRSPDCLTLAKKSRYWPTDPPPLDRMRTSANTGPAHPRERAKAIANAFASDRRAGGKQFKEISFIPCLHRRTGRIPSLQRQIGPNCVQDGAPEALGNRGSPGLKPGPWGTDPTARPLGTLKPRWGEAKKRNIPVTTRSVSMLMAAAFACFALSPALAADDPVVARVNGTEIKQSDLDHAPPDLGPRLSNFSAEDRKKVLLQYLIETELIAAAGRTDNLDKNENFPGRMKYYERRALRDAYFDLKIYQAVTEAEAKKIYDEKIGQVKPEQEIHARHI